MRVQTEEWRRFIPGVRMYKGKKTLFYNGEILWERDALTGDPLIYNKDERRSWEVIIVLPGVEVIASSTFIRCLNVKTVIMADSVRRVDGFAFDNCRSLSYVRLSRNLREIGDHVFLLCKKLIILSVPRYTRLGHCVIASTALIEASPFPTNEYGSYDNKEEVNHWIQTHHADNEFSLHRFCCYDNLSDEIILEIIKSQGLHAFGRPDSVGITPWKYLSENPFTEMKEQTMVNLYILDMMGEIV